MAGKMGDVAWAVYDGELIRVHWGAYDGFYGWGFGWIAPDGSLIEGYATEGEAWAAEGLRALRESKRLLRRGEALQARARGLLQLASELGWSGADHHDVDEPSPHEKVS